MQLKLLKGSEDGWGLAQRDLCEAKGAEWKVLDRLAEDGDDERAFCQKWTPIDSWEGYTDPVTNEIKEDDPKGPDACFMGHYSPFCDDMLAFAYCAQQCSPWFPRDPNDFGKPVTKICYDRFEPRTGIDLVLGNPPRTACEYAQQTNFTGWCDVTYVIGPCARDADGNVVECTDFAMMFNSAKKQYTRKHVCMTPFPKEAPGMSAGTVFGIFVLVVALICGAVWFLKCRD